jgi:hypothetical protein
MTYFLDLNIYYSWHMCHLAAMKPDLVESLESVERTLSKQPLDTLRSVVSILSRIPIEFNHFILGRYTQRL